MVDFTIDEKVGGVALVFAGIAYFITFYNSSILSSMSKSAVLMVPSIAFILGGYHVFSQGKYSDILLPVLAWSTVPGALFFLVVTSLGGGASFAGVEPNINVLTYLYPVASLVAVFSGGIDILEEFI
jgi:hypothetical protein